jgi:glyoxylase-like metal-dependent hydrolase (beta-lactamase superfamily II)
VRYVINTHHHSDHSGGLRYMMAEGITILTHNSARGYYEKVYNSVHTLGQDALAQKSPKPALKVETFGDRKVISDAMNTIEIHRVEDSTHAEGMVIVYLPKQKAVLEADEFNVGGAPPTAPPDTVNPYHSNMLANFERLRLDIDRIVPVHLPGDGRKVTMAELRTMAGRAN